MPEGPTIVVFKKKLEKFSGKTVTESGGYNNPYQDQISGKKLISLGTFGKYLLLDFGDFFITVHFGLYGSFLIKEQKKVNPSFTLFFGEDYVNFYVVKIKKIDDKNIFNEKLNVFSEQYDVAATEELLIGKKFLTQKVGDVLMNQDIFPGVGNIIRNEVLFMSDIHPESIVGKIPQEKIRELLQNIRKFSLASVPLIEGKIWKSSAAVYQKQLYKGDEVTEYVSQKIKRKTFVNEKTQKLYR
ncbi:hypothetical protein J4771_01605 [Candidatus Kaistella beijingensis]|uniref:DNA-formamidopyrimidine glycosylase family protein n=1 Tax=Candidatus Kaistella beijingensis TaxID=2820270 RepID=UPI001CC7C833|nr:DNA-formamidopyrimidine glycosylase family protein [Candidatus Kaistella beijingensis]UBB90072.1 hypothetical protein J4771_01605 [Candidatus Kaistella beijingensis]